MSDHTIAQIATPTGAGGISIIKISGDKSLEIIKDIFVSQIPKEFQSHKLNYGYICEGKTKIDEVLMTYMKGSQTSTGEDIVEINCHGGILLTNKILMLVIKKGAKLAQKGEFTQRAYLNGKKTLEEVELILDITHAQNEDALNLAINSLNNSTSNLVENLRQKLLEIVTNIEVNIDYPEYDDINIVKNKDIKIKMNNLIENIQNIIEDSKRGEIIKTGIQTALIGTPNVGKSSILNYLSKKEKAIVTNVPGTTRDINESNINLGKITLNLLDTAGIRETEDIVEKVGVQKSLEQIQKAELVLLILDATRKPKAIEKEILETLKKKKKNYLIIINKVDVEENKQKPLEQQNLFEEENLVNKLYLEKLKIKKENYTLMSALNKTGEQQLVEKLEEKFDLKNFEPNNSKHIAQLDIRIKLEEVLKKLHIVKEDLEKDTFIDLLLIDLKDVLFILSELLGLNPKEDYLNEIFSRFCLGK